MGSTITSSAKSYVYLDANVAMSHYGVDTGAFKQRIAGAFVIKDIKAIEQIIHRANQEGLKLWPISGGMNFGYGTAMPVKEANYIVDLTELKAIEFNPDSHSVTIEPGVNQQDLADFLDLHNLPYLVPTTGLGPNGSLLGNALDGGYGLTPACDHFDAISEFEGVMGNGVPFRHGFREFGCDTMAQSWSSGTGANLNGLLRQGNFAIVTKATIQLARKPEASRVLIIEWPSEDAFIDAQDKLSTIMEDVPGIGGIITMNAARVLSAQQDAPLANRLTGEQRLSYLDELAKRRKIAPWTSMATLYGSKNLVKGAVKDIRRRLAKAKVWSFTVPNIKRLVKLMSWIPKRYLRHLHRHVGMLQESIGTVEGRPLVAFLQMAYALDDKKLEMTQQRNPAKDGQGILWYGPLVNINKQAMTDYIRCMRQVLHHYGFDNLLAVTARSSRVHCGTIPLIFHKEDETSVARAKACYRALVKEGIKHGMPPYRIGTEYMDEIYINESSGFMQSLLNIKYQLDPNEVIAPGRYLPTFASDKMKQRMWNG